METIHDYNKRYELAVRNLEKSTAISEKNKSLIFRHKDWLLCAKNLSKARTIKCIWYL